MDKVFRKILNCSGDNTSLSFKVFFQITVSNVIAIASTNIALLTDRVIVGIYNGYLMNDLAVGVCLINTFLIFGLSATSGVENSLISSTYDKNNLLIYKNLSGGIIFSASYFVLSFILICLFLFFDGHCGVLYATIVSPTIFTSMIACTLRAYLISSNSKSLLIVLSVFFNLINLGLDYLFVICLKTGIIGAGIATVISNLIYLVLISYIVAKQIKFSFHFDLKHTMKDILDGIPCAISASLEGVAWFVMLKILENHTNNSYLSSYVLLNSIMSIMIFFSEGVSKAVLNLHSIATKHNSERHLLQLIFYLSLIFSLIVFIVNVLVGNAFIQWYNSFFAVKCNLSVTSLHIFAGFLIFDLIAYALGGLLIAKRNTKYLMMSNLISIWIAGVIPLSIIVKMELPIDFISVPLFLYALCNASFLLFGIGKKIEKNTLHKTRQNKTAGR